MAIVVFKVVTMVLKRIERFVLDSPATSTTSGNHLIEKVSMIGWFRTKQVTHFQWGQVGDVGERCATVHPE